MARLPRLRVLSAPIFLLFLTTAGDALSKPGDPADRGLDLFVHAPKTVRAGDAASIDLLAYGFVSVTQPKPLDRAAIVATWDPESLGAGVATAPGDISATTDTHGHATITVPMPDGDARKLTLLIALRHGEHLRTRKIEIDRVARSTVSLRVADALVVPGSQIPAWVTVTDAQTGNPRKNTSVDVSLREGDLTRATERVTTDGSGIARATLWVPKRATGTPALTLRARLPTANNGFVDDVVSLGLREERPATPVVRATWAENELKPGEVGHATIELLDAAGEPIANHEVRYWSGPKGTSPPATDEEWIEKTKPVRTDGLGKITFTAQAPRVVTQLGSTMTVVARTEIEGQQLDAKDDLKVGQRVAEAYLELEAGVLVPGAKQRAFLHVLDANEGVAGTFVVEGDGVKTEVKTDANGDGELLWMVPEDIGARRANGPCAGGVAASVSVRQASPIAALARHPEPFQLCVEVAREEVAILRPSVYIARVGDKPTVTLEGGKRAAHLAGSVTLTASDGTGKATWSLTDAATIDLTNATPGIHYVTFAVPRADAKAQTTTTQLLVIPKTLPKATAKIVTTKLTPGADVDVDVALDDGHGHPLVGSVSAVVIDKEGGGSISGLEWLDTRLGLCYQGRATKDRCDTFLEGDASAETLRRMSLSTAPSIKLVPSLDPVADAKKELKETFSAVLHSLEGAIFQATTPESLRDVRRKENGRWVWNPELMTLVTAAMSEEPTTPGGDPFKLNDLIAVDPQVTFDNAARRVTRLRLFNVLSSVHSFVQSESLTPDEPLMKDPNALLRRMVRDGKVDSGTILDPWGGTFQFVHVAGPAIPFLTAFHGWELHAPGPDGAIGTGDDVKDPFERVVKSGSPYAVAMGEDEIVDSRLDMRVGETTISHWQEMFDRLTGRMLGSGERSGGTGTGQGFGAGHGRLGGAHRTKAPSLRMGMATVTDSTRWTDPVRTDDSGHARVRVHLGDHETTWTIALLARTDAGQSALASVEAPAFLPLSAHIDLGRRLTQGDRAGARIVVRNRTTVPKTVTLQVGAEGALALAPKSASVYALEVPASSVRSLFARGFSAQTVGTGRATVLLRSPGMDDDKSTDEIEIQPPGESLVIANSIQVPGHGKLHVTRPTGFTEQGRARLILESGLEGAMMDALASFEPEPTTPPETLADAIEVASRIEKIGEARNDKALVARTHAAAALARMYLQQHESSTTPRVRAVFAHAALYPAPPEDAKRPPPRRDAATACPKEAAIDMLPIAMLLETEPTPTSDGPPACFTSLMARLTSKAPLDLARASLALADRPHRAALGANLTRDLAEQTGADKGSFLFDGTRAERVIVLAALARSTAAWTKNNDADAVGHRLAETILTLRDAHGGYGSAEATRDAVRAFVALDSLFPPKGAHVTWTAGKTKGAVDVPARGATVVALEPGTFAAEIDVTGGPVIARFERPILRNWVAVPDTTVSPVKVEIEWPADVRVNTTGVVHVSYTSATAHEIHLLTTLPLPTGVELAGRVEGAALRQGVVYLHPKVTGTATISLPVRFTLPGTVLIPEAETHTTSEQQPRSLSPARWLTVQ